MEKQYRDAFSSPLHTAVITYTYDSMNRLVSENCGDSRISYKYDLSGNRISRDTDGRTENYLYNSRNQLTQLTGDDKNISYTYDPAGNLTEEHSTEHKKIYSYDTYNRNTEITGNDFTQKNHYDAEGYRYSIEENDKVTNFVYRRGIMLAELDEDKNPARHYVLGNEYIGLDHNYYLTDEQGSVRYVLDAAGNVQNDYRYDAFGQRIAGHENIPNRLRYNAQIEDDLTGLYYLRARYYNTGIGRFTQEDVIYNDGLNLYAYCSSNPVMYSDPSGYSCETKDGAENSKSGRNAGLKEFDIVPYGKFKDYPGDGLTGHELLQNAWLEANGKIPKRGVGLSTKNPAIALRENPIHKFISGQQKSLGLNKKNLAGTSWRKNVLDNIQILKDAGVPRDKIAELAWQTRKFAIDNGF